MKRLYIVSWCSAALAVLVFWQTHVPTTMRPGAGPLVKKSWLISESASLTPKDLCRAPDQTFLTYPEWFLVFGPAEYADYLQHHTATSFPLMTHVFQAWESYAAVDDQIRGTFPPNDEYQTMIQVINTSSSIEFGIKAVYEAIIGRMTDSRDGSIETPEDQFAGNYARDYVSFLDTAPWYEFDFIAPLKRLWADTPLVGQHPIRKLERRYFLTTELTVKAAYGWALGLAGKAA
ncbi:MAG: hypothetical protein KDK97_18525, partial [Verrucomicrobiales bacterium]|nr:hypothetical protein [Verrucomicrobiales bacterium]